MLVKNWNLMHEQLFRYIYVVPDTFQMPTFFLPDTWYRYLVPVVSYYSQSVRFGYVWYTWHMRICYFALTQHNKPVCTPINNKISGRKFFGSFFSFSSLFEIGQEGKWWSAFPNRGPNFGKKSAWSNTCLFAGPATTTVQNPHNLSIRQTRNYCCRWPTVQ